MFCQTETHRCTSGHETIFEIPCVWMKTRPRRVRGMNQWETAPASGAMDINWCRWENPPYSRIWWSLTSGGSLIFGWTTFHLGFWHPFHKRIRYHIMVSRTDGGIELSPPEAEHFSILASNFIDFAIELSKISGLRPTGGKVDKIPYLLPEVP